MVLGSISFLVCIDILIFFDKVFIIMNVRQSVRTMSIQYSILEQDYLNF